MTNKMNVPQVRDRLVEIANETNNPELHFLADQLYRNPAVSRADASSTTFTPELAEEIRQYAKNNPGKNQQEIAIYFNVNHGRVSEALNNLM